MGLFKKALSFLIEEDDETIVDEPMKPVNQNIREEYLEPIIPLEPTKPKPVVNVEVKMEQVQEEPVVSRKVKHIEVDDVKPGKNTIKRNESYKKDFEVTPVISPMFGSKKEEKSEKDGKPVVLKGKKKSNLLGTVISPMYGSNELEKFENEAQQKISEKQKEKEIVIESFEQEEIENVPLPSLLEKEIDNNEDMVQFSLFGEEEKVMTSQLIHDDEE